MSEGGRSGGRKEPHAMNRSLAVLAVVLLTLGLTITPASAITNGELDGEGHPSVGAVLAFVPNRPTPLLCTSVLVHPRVVLTAGHCLHGFNARGVPTDELVIRFAPNFNAPGVIDRAVAGGFIHPDYVPGEERQPFQEDIAALILAEPVTDIVPSRRAPLGFMEDLDAQGLLQTGPERTRMIRVGYGFGLDFPPASYIPFDGFRRVTTSELQAVQHSRLVMNGNQAAGNGGVCFYDSGGPAFWQDPATGEKTVVSLVSWGTGQCIANDMSTRIDTPDAVWFIEAAIACAEDGSCG